LVRLPSARGQEAAAQKLVASELHRLGLEVSNVYVDPKELSKVRGFSPTAVDYTDRPNVVGYLRGAGGGKSLALNFHIDTAAVGPTEFWSYDPHSGEFKDGKVFGRGAWDDKAGCALAALVLQALRDSNIKLKGDLQLQSVIEDETSGNGTLALVAQGHVADATLILDGAYGATGIIAHPGSTNIRVTIYGKPAPSCRSSLGENAIEKAWPIVQTLRTLEAKMNEQLPPEWRNVDHPINFNLGTIAGGTWFGAVADKCTFEAQMTFLAPWTLASFRQKLLEEISVACQRDAWLKDHPPAVEFFDMETEPLWLDVDNDFMHLLSKNCKTVFGEELVARSVTGWCDLRHLSLHKQVPACLFGPGRGANAHRPDEYFEVDQLIPHARVLVQQILDWCEIAE
jgi:acetylornithine deacetylase